MMRFNALLMIAVAAALSATAPTEATAQVKYPNRVTPSFNPSPNRDIGPRRPRGFRGPGWGAVATGVILAIPALTAPYADDDGVIVEDAPQHRPRAQRARRQNPSGAPPAGERRLVPDEVVIELANTASTRQIDSLQRRHRLARLQSQSVQLTGTTFYRWRIPDRRSVATVVRALERDALVASAQPNYLFTLQDDAAADDGKPPQYELAKLNLPQAHTLVRGGNVRVAVIDSAVDLQNPELAGSIAGTFDSLDAPHKPHMHGTAIAGLIAAHGKLTGAAPEARILAVRAFNPEGGSAEGTTFAILKGIDWAAANDARIINMSFAGPSDPALLRSLAAAHKKGIVLIAAAGNAGPKSPPLFPAADPNVIAVTATDSGDRLFEASNRGRHIAIAAPGADVLVATHDGYEVSSGTSYSAATVSGIAALMLARDPKLTPVRLRKLLETTAKDLGPKGQDSQFGFGLADAYGAVAAEVSPVAESVPLPPVRASTGAR